MSTPSPARFRLLRLLALTVAIAMLAVACARFAWKH